MTRNYAIEMRRLIDATTASGPYVPRIAATEIVEKLRATDRELLLGWLNEQAEHFIWQAINDRDRSRRAKAAVSAKGEEFAGAVKQHENGDSSSLRHFLDAPYSVENGSRKRLAELTRADLIYVADNYQQRSAEMAMKSAFMTALAKKVASGTVSDHFTEEQIAAMWTSLSS